MPSVYDALTEHLKGIRTNEVVINFASIENILGRPLPKSAVRPQFWANQQNYDNRPQRKACRAAGFDTFLIKPDKVRFVRTR